MSFEYDTHYTLFYSCELKCTKIDYYLVHKLYVLVRMYIVKCTLHICPDFCNRNTVVCLGLVKGSQRLYISRLLKDDKYLFYLDSKNRVILYKFSMMCAVLPSENPAKEKYLTAISRIPLPHCFISLPFLIATG